MIPQAAGAGPSESRTTPASLSYIRWTSPQSRNFQRLEMPQYLFSLVLIWLLVVYLLFFTGKRDYYRFFYCNCLFYYVFTIPFASRPLGWAGKLRASIIRERLKGMDFLKWIQVRPAQSQRWHDKVPQQVIMGSLSIQRRTEDLSIVPTFTTLSRFLLTKQKSHHRRQVMTLFQQRDSIF